MYFLTSLAHYAIHNLCSLSYPAYNNSRTFITYAWGRDNGGSLGEENNGILYHLPIKDQSR